MALVNSNLTCSNSCYRCLSYQKRGQESLVSLILIHWIEIYHVDNAIHLLNNRVWIPNFKPQNWFQISLQEKNSQVPESGLYRTLRISITDSILQCGNRDQGRKQDMIPWLPRKLLVWNCYPRKRIHCTCHLVTLNIFHWVKNLPCHLCFLLVGIFDGCYFLYNELSKKKK